MVPKRWQLAAGEFLNWTIPFSSFFPKRRNVLFMVLDHVSDKLAIEPASTHAHKLLPFFPRFSGWIPIWPNAKPCPQCPNFLPRLAVIAD